ncbi:25217_t:CDS:10 [Cetraspora pellucida]|uniref:25217_t:CDS:1 n=1 Tax=Cetraspora pellucida TaxID=1433469 RepID=A0A9N8WA31_9GLOM|nr:25217_t:CDS:10 [Cetraspora pellucida]
MGQNSCNLSPTKPKILVGYYPAYKLNLAPGVDFDINPSIDYLNYIAFGPSDLVNNAENNNTGGDPFKNFNSQSYKFNQLSNYRSSKDLKFKIILSILLPTDRDNLIKFFNKQSQDPENGWYNSSSTQNTKFINELVNIVTTNSFDGIDIDYPFKFPCNPSTGFNETDFSNFLSAISARLGNKNLTITAGQYAIKGINPNIISFINIKAFHLNINNTYASAGIDRISEILNDWNFIDHSKLVLGVEFGGIVEIVSDNDNSIKSDIESKKLKPVNDSNFQFSFSNGKIPDQCGHSSYAYWSWKNLITNLVPPCYTRIDENSQWNYGFINDSKQPYLHRQDLSSQYYYVAFYEDYQSLNAKLDYINNKNLAGIAIADITKDSSLINFILGNNPVGNKTLVGGVIGSLIFVSVLVAAGFILYRRRHTNVITTVVAMFDYAGKEENDLSFKAGDRIEVLERGDGPNDWWVGRLRGVVGEFPGNIHYYKCHMVSNSIHYNIGNLEDEFNIHLVTVLSQDQCNLSPTKPNKLIGYYPAYKLNSKPGVDFNISPSINYLNYIAFGPNDLVNNGADGGPSKFFDTSKFFELSNYIHSNSPKSKIILSVLLPTDKNNLTQFFNKQSDLDQGWYNPTSTQNKKLIGDLITIVKNFSFDGIDIDYPFKFPCYPSIGFNDSDFPSFLSAISEQLDDDKSLTVTAGQYPIKGFNFSYVDFVNIQAFHLNINSVNTSSGLDGITQILNSWNITDTDKSKFTLGIEFGGIAEIVSSKNITYDIESQQFQLVNGTNFTFPFPNVPISDQCNRFSYAYLSWENLSHSLLSSSSSCPTILTSLSPWEYGFANSSQQPYLYKQNSSNQPSLNSSNSSSTYYVIFYEDYQSLNAKIDYIKKHSAIVGGVLGSIVFVSALIAIGIILYRRRHSTGKVVANVIAMFDYVGKEENDLSFKAGDVIEVLEKGDGPNDWWVGRLRGVVGEFPGNYVKEVM